MGIAKLEVDIEFRLSLEEVENRRTIQRNKGAGCWSILPECIHSGLLGPLLSTNKGQRARNINTTVFSSYQDFR